MDFNLKWTEDNKNHLKDLISENIFSYADIAEKMKTTVNSVALQSRRLGLSSRPRMIKHKHLREKVMIYFLNHSYEECSEKFNLTRSQLKSVFSAAYKDPAFNRLRKDNRRKDPWSVTECVFLLKHLGIRNRDWIAKKLKRGTKESVKENMFRMGIRAINMGMNGMNLSRALEFFGDDIKEYGIKTKAGPSNSYQFILVPWVSIYWFVKKRKEDYHEDIVSCLKAMAFFQKKVFHLNSEKAIVKEITRICGLK